MNSSALFVITEDPRSSGRPAEAVRVAAGIGVWKRVDVTVYLRGAAALVLGENTDDLVDEENFARYLPVLREGGRPIYVQKGAISPGQIDQATMPFEEITDAQLAELAASRNCVFRF
jgi:hypothetical protein